jgi:hypothetical protein
MSQDLRSRPDEGRDSSSRAGDKVQVRSRFEGFEGMNYEQRRPAYSPQRISNSDRNGSNESKGKRRDEC